MAKKHGLHLLALTSAAALLVACDAPGNFMDARCARRGGTPAKAGSAEDLLAAEGSWNIVEEDTGNIDPASMHKIAKKRVDPSSMQKKTFVPQSALASAASESGQDVNYRLLRVERDVAGLRSDFKRLLPPLSNLIVADRALDQTIETIQSADAARAAAPPVMPVGTPAPLKTMAEKQVINQAAPAAVSSAAKPAAAKAMAGQSAVSAIRFGEHPGKTRIVLDISGPVNFRSDVDNNENLVMIELPQAGWTAAAKKALKHPLIAGYTAQPSAGGGTVLALEMKKPVKVLGGSALPPNATYNNHRVFIDIAAL